MDESSQKLMDLDKQLNQQKHLHLVGSRVLDH